PPYWVPPYIEYSNSISIPLVELNDTPSNATAPNCEVVFVNRKPSFVNAALFVPALGRTTPSGCVVLRKDILYGKRVTSCAYNDTLLKRKTIKAAKIV